MTVCFDPGLEGFKVPPARPTACGALGMLAVRHHVSVL